MPRIEWSDALRVGVKDLDEQHEDLTAVINDLYDAHLEGRDEELVRDIVEEVRDLARHVFDTEQALMDEGGYAGSAEHAAEHAALLSRGVGPLLAWADGRADLTVRLLEALADGWAAHMDGADRRLAEALKTKGAA